LYAPNAGDDGVNARRDIEGPLSPPAGNMPPVLAPLHAVSAVIDAIARKRTIDRFNSKTSEDVRPAPLIHCRSTGAVPMKKGRAGAVRANPPLLIESELSLRSR
jgi:hypothetical protein